MAKILIAVMAALAIMAGLALTVSEEGQAQQTDTPTPTESPAPSPSPSATATATAAATGTTSATATPTFNAPSSIVATGGEAGSGSILPTLALLAGASVIVAGTVLLAAAWKRTGSEIR